jgi:hypothetical protein
MEAAVRVNFEISAVLHDALKRQADLQGRSVSDVMRQLIVEFIERDTARMGKIIADYEKNGPKQPIVLPKKENADD